MLELQHMQLLQISYNLVNLWSIFLCSDKTKLRARCLSELASDTREVLNFVDVVLLYKLLFLVTCGIH